MTADFDEKWERRRKMQRTVLAVVAVVSVIGVTLPLAASLW